MTNTLFWQVPVGALATLLTARFLAAPYQLHKEDVAEATRSRAALELSHGNALRVLERKNEELEAKVRDFENLPVTVELSELSNARLIAVTVTNHRDKIERVKLASLSMQNIKGETETWDRIVWAKSERIAPFPHAMERRSSFELRFFSSINGFLSYGISSVTALVTMETGRVVSSTPKDLSADVPSDCYLSRSLGRGLSRHERIWDFVERFIAVCTPAQVYFEGHFHFAMKAEIWKLEDNSKLTEACFKLIEKDAALPFPISQELRTVTLEGE